MSRGALAVLGDASSSSLLALDSFLVKYKVPFFSWSLPFYKDDGQQLSGAKAKDQLEELAAAAAMSTEYGGVRGDGAGIESGVGLSVAAFDALAASAEVEAFGATSMRNMNAGVGGGGVRGMPANLNRLEQTHVDGNRFVVNLHPAITPTLISLIKYNRWKTIYYLYNHEEG